MYRVKIGLKDAEFYAYHGFYEEERLMGNYFTINLQVELASNEVVDDKLENTINYEMLYQVCQEEMMNSQFLLETVCQNILNRINQKTIVYKKIRIDKLGVQLGGKIGSSWVEMESE